MPYIVIKKVVCFFCDNLKIKSIWESPSSISKDFMPFDLNDVDIWNREHLKVIMTSQ